MRPLHGLTALLAALLVSLPGAVTAADPGKTLRVAFNAAVLGTIL